MSSSLIKATHFKDKQIPYSYCVLEFGGEEYSKSVGKVVFVTNWESSLAGISFLIPAVGMRG